MTFLHQNLSGIMSALLLILFLGICLWSWSGQRKAGFDKMAQLPLEDDNIKDIKEDAS